MQAWFWSGDEQVLVFVEWLRVTPRQLQHNRAIYCGQFLIELAEAWVMTDRFFVGISSIPAWDALSIAGRGAEDEQGANIGEKEMRWPCSAS